MQPVWQLRHSTGIIRLDHINLYLYPSSYKLLQANTYPFVLFSRFETCILKSSMRVITSRAAGVQTAAATKSRHPHCNSSRYTLEVSRKTTGPTSPRRKTITKDVRLALISIAKFSSLGTGRRISGPQQIHTYNVCRRQRDF